MKIYISGKITGTTDFMERFKAVEERLTAEGHKVFNPAHANYFMPDGTSYEEYMRVSFCLLDMADAIYMMHGWEDSSGAKKGTILRICKGQKDIIRRYGRQRICIFGV